MNTPETKLPTETAVASSGWFSQGGKMQNFERAFDTHSGGCRRTCECGKEYWDAHNSGYSWEDGETEALEADPKAVALPHSVGTVAFEGGDYVADCPCWRQRAEQIMRFIDGRSRQIAEYLSLEKKRKQSEADTSPVVG